MRIVFQPMVAKFYQIYQTLNSEQFDQFDKLLNQGGKKKYWSNLISKFCIVDNLFSLVESEEEWRKREVEIDALVEKLLVAIYEIPEMKEQVQFLLKFNSTQK